MLLWRFVTNRHKTSQKSQKHHKIISILFYTPLNIIGNRVWSWEFAHTYFRLVLNKYNKLVEAHRMFLELGASKVTDVFVTFCDETSQNITKITTSRERARQARVVSQSCVETLAWRTCANRADFCCWNCNGSHQLFKMVLYFLNRCLVYYVFLVVYW